MSNGIARIRSVAAVVVLLAAFSFSARADEPYQLANGLTVILRTVSGAEQVAVVVLFDLGGDHDPVGKSGMGHLLEHLYCTSGAGNTVARDFAQIQTRYVAGYNQQTGSDYTVFAGVIGPEKLEEELKDAACRMSALRITDEDLQRELPRVLLELSHMYGGYPWLAGLNNVRMILHPIQQGGRPGGADEQLKTIRLDDLQQRWQNYYKPNNAVLVLAGKFDVAQVRQTIQQYFGPIAVGKAPPAKPPQPLPKIGTTNSVKVKPAKPQATGVVSVGYAAPLPGSGDYAPFLLVVSRLWALSQGAPLDRVLPLYYPPLDDPTTIALQAPLQASKDAGKILNELDQQLHAALTAKVEPQDRLMAINSMAMMGTLDMPDAMWAQNLYGLAFSLGRRHQLRVDGKELRSAILRVTDEGVQHLAETIFSTNRRVAMIVKAVQ